MASPTPPVNPPDQPRISYFDRLILRIKRGDSVLMRAAKKTIRLLMWPTVPRIPRALRTPFRMMYELHYLAIVVGRALIMMLYRGPLFQSKCASFGRGVTLEGKMPFVSGHVQIEIGDNVFIGGNLTVISGGLFDRPRLVLKDRASLGWNVTIVVNREVIIEEDARIPYDCRISDSDGHPKEADLRRAGLPPDIKNILPVRICRDAWIGNGSHIMKGVTIGEGAIIGANSVVISNIPPFALALGNPAEVLFKNYGVPSDYKKPSPPAPKTTIAGD